MPASYHAARLMTHGQHRRSARAARRPGTPLMLVDANLLLYAVDESSPRHQASRDWLNAAMTGDRRVAIPWQSLSAFVRITTNPRASSRPLSPVDAWGFVTDWLRCEVAWTPHPRSPRRRARLTHPEVRPSGECDYRRRARGAGDRARSEGLLGGHGFRPIHGDRVGQSARVIGYRRCAAHARRTGNGGAGSTRVLDRRTADEGWIAARERPPQQQRSHRAPAASSSYGRGRSSRSRQ